MDRKQIILSSVAGLATIAVSYLVWRHEQLISASNSAANLQAQQDASDAANQQLLNEIGSLPTSGGSAGSYTPQYGDTSSGGLQTPASSSSDLQSILNAFYPTNPTTPTSTAGVSAQAQTRGGTASVLPQQGTTNTIAGNFTNGTSNNGGTLPTTSTANFSVPSTAGIIGSSLLRGTGQ